MVRLHRHPYKLQTFHICQTSLVLYHLLLTSHQLELQTCCNLLSVIAATAHFVTGFFREPYDPSKIESFFSNGWIARFEVSL